MNNFRIIRGTVRDFPLQDNYYREGWWWHSSGTPDGYEFGYAPEGPFMTKAHAQRHLWNTMRLHRVAQRTGRWPTMAKNAGWCPGWGGRTSNPTMKPLKGSRFFGEKFRRYINENS
jgi:hypothetical protein